jgi:cytochrome c556
VEFSVFLSVNIDFTESFTDITNLSLHRRIYLMKISIKIALLADLLFLLAAVGLSCSKADPMADIDSRKPIKLTAEQRNYFLSEMREMMFSLNGSLAGIYSGQKGIAVESARRSGSSNINNIGDVPGDLNERLPLEFKNFRAATHVNFDELAEMLENKKDNREIMGKLTSLTGNCASCHAMYRIVNK